MSNYRINNILDVLNGELKAIADSEELSFSKSDLAAKLHLSERTIERLFNDKLKCSFTKFFPRLRIEYGAQLLLSTQLSVADIARKVGYTPSAFSKEFKNHFPNATPAKFRKNERRVQHRANKRNFEVIELPEIHLIYNSHIGSYTELNSVKKEQVLFDTLVELATNEGVIKLPIESYGIAFDDAGVRDNADCRYYACIEVKEPIKKSYKEINNLTVPASKYAKYLHKGSYSELDLLYEDVFCDLVFNPNDTFAWNENHYILEHYLNNVQNNIEDDLLTEVLFPIR